MHRSDCVEIMSIFIFARCLDLCEDVFIGLNCGRICVIIKGEEDESEGRNMILEGFQPYIIAAGSVSITFSKNGLGVSKAAVAKLRNSKHVKILIDGKGKRLAIQICDANDVAATEFSKSEKPEGVRWNTRDLNQTIQSMMGWPTDEKQCYKVEGVYVDDDDYPALVFDLKMAIEQS